MIIIILLCGRCTVLIRELLLLQILFCLWYYFDGINDCNCSQWHCYCCIGSVGYDPLSGNQEWRSYPHQQKPLVSHMTITSCIKFRHMHIHVHVRAHTHTNTWLCIIPHTRNVSRYYYCACCPLLYSGLCRSFLWWVVQLLLCSSSSIPWLMHSIFGMDLHLDTQVSHRNAQWSYK